jgi:hypothetical protein
MHIRGADHATIAAASRAVFGTHVHGSNGQDHQGIVAPMLSFEDDI